MDHGDHVFDDIVAKLHESCSSGLGELRSVKAASSSAAVWTNLSEQQDSWLRHHLPRTREALELFQRHPELAALRDQLQTSPYFGAAVSGPAYSSASMQFESAVKLFFRQLGSMRSARNSSSLLPVITAVRRTYYHMARAAEDPTARARLLAEAQPSERAKLEAHWAQVQKSLDWAWERCEYLFRMVASEALALPR